jgi:hypothetical protein
MIGSLLNRNSQANNKRSVGHISESTFAKTKHIAENLFYKKFTFTARSAKPKAPCKPQRTGTVSNLLISNSGAQAEGQK